MVEEPYPEFKGFSAVSRLSRPCIITEKIDGTNGLVCVYPDYRFSTNNPSKNSLVLAGSRTQWLTPEKDNHGFAGWVLDHTEELKSLGVGYHWGEWWGQGINRKYGLKEKRFSLFNTTLWENERPACCSVVPILYKGIFCSEAIAITLEQLRVGGSVAAPGFMKPEGIVIFHEHSRTLFKKTLENDEVPKGKA